MNALIKALTVVPTVVAIIRKIDAAARQDSPGGKKITSDEIAEIVSSELKPLVEAILKAAGHESA
jgi:hypothetical protein